MFLRGLCQRDTPAHMPLLISDHARNKANALGLDVQLIAEQHTGSGHVLTKEDVIRYAAAHATVSVHAAVAVARAEELVKEQAMMADVEGSMPPEEMSPPDTPSSSAGSSPTPLPSVAHASGSRGGGQSTSQAATTRDPDDDPLLLNGCTINFKWPRKGETCDRTGVIKFRPLPGKKRRYVVLMERAGGTREKKTNWRKLKRREYTVVSSPYKKKGTRWTDIELEAAKRRQGAPVRESDESIGVSLDRTGRAVDNKLAKTLNPAHEPQGGKVGPSSTARPRRSQTR